MSGAVFVCKDCTLEFSDAITAAMHSRQTYHTIKADFSVPAPSPSAAPAGEKGRTSFWVVERFLDGRSAGYWTGAHSRDFTFDIECCVHFCRRDDARAVLGGWHWNDIQITEHMYMDAAPATEKCGQPAASLIPRWGMGFSCALPKGHGGGHRTGGTCHKHGEYVMADENDTPKCPRCPDCVSAAPPAAAPAGEKEERSAYESSLGTCECCKRTHHPVTEVIVCWECFEDIVAAASPLDRGQLAKFFWDYGKHEAEADHERRWSKHLEFADWPEGSDKQPYCQWAYRLADAFLVWLAVQHFRRQG